MTPQSIDARRSHPHDRDRTASAARGAPRWVTVFNPIAKLLLARRRPAGLQRAHHHPRPDERPAAHHAAGDHRGRRQALGLGPVGRRPLGAQPARRGPRDHHGPRRRTEEVTATELDPTQRVAFFRDVLGPVARGMQFGCRSSASSTASISTIRSKRPRAGRVFELHPGSLTAGPGRAGTARLRAAFAQGHRLSGMHGGRFIATPDGLRRFAAVLLAGGALIGLFTVRVSYAAAPDVRIVTPAGITIDGSAGDWDSLGPDFLADMYQAGIPTKQVLSKVYGRYDCGTGTFYMYVETVPNWVILPSNNDNYVKLGQSQKLVDGNDSGRTQPPAFAYIGEHGWEVAFKLAPGSYTGDGGLNVHAEVTPDRSRRHVGRRRPPDGRRLLVPDADPDADDGTDDRPDRPAAPRRPAELAERAAVPGTRVAVGTRQRAPPARGLRARASFPRAASEVASASASALGAAVQNPQRAPLEAASEPEPCRARVPELPSALPASRSERPRARARPRARPPPSPEASPSAEASASAEPRRSASGREPSEAPSGSVEPVREPLRQRRARSRARRRSSSRR